MPFHQSPWRKSWWESLNFVYTRLNLRVTNKRCVLFYFLRSLVETTDVAGADAFTKLVSALCQSLQRIPLHRWWCWAKILFLGNSIAPGYLQLKLHLCVAQRNVPETKWSHSLVSDVHSGVIIGHEQLRHFLSASKQDQKLLHNHFC